MVARSRATDDKDRVPPAPETPVSRAGDIWTLGDHRIMCGDITQAECVEALLSGEKPHLMVTDPPYGIEYDANWRNEVERSGRERHVGCVRLAMSKTITVPIGRMPIRSSRGMWPMFGTASLKGHIFLESLISSGFGMPEVKLFGQSRTSRSVGGTITKSTSSCWYAVRKGGKGHWQGSRKETTLWEIPEAAEIRDRPQHTEAR